ncbi:MAG: ATP synthase F1 subunit delta [Lachnospiraceae bacterium]|nr:ATP synthase F1 subunit delta [Lachnospiraceae bacterium]
MTQSAIDRASVLYSLTDDVEMIKKLKEIISVCPEFTSVLVNPTIDKEKKFNIIDKVCEKEDILPIIKNFLKVMCEQDEIVELMDILEEFEKLWDKKHNIVRAQIIFGRKPSEEEKTKVLSEVKKHYSDYDVREEISVDESLLGGYVVRVGYNETDMSYEGCFKQLERKLIRR